MLAPEYVGHGWGIAALPIGDDRLWSVHANIYAGDAIPYESEGEGPVLQLKFYEGTADYLTRQDTGEDWYGHREDWFLDEQGLEKLDSKRVGPPVCLQAPWLMPGSCRDYAPKDPDIRHREVMLAPQVTMTRS